MLLLHRMVVAGAGAGAGTLLSLQQPPQQPLQLNHHRKGRHSSSFNNNNNNNNLCLMQRLHHHPHHHHCHRCLFSLTPALRRDAENLNEDSDDVMFDELFKKYGKVVYSSDDKKSPAAEIDDDADSLSFAVAMAKVASEVKAGDIKVLFVKPLVYWTRFFIIATAFSRPQIDAIGSRIRDLAEKRYGRIPSGDSKPNSWTLLDFGDVVVHIFLPQQRAFYNLEEFYGNATPIELPFENQPPFRS